MAVVLAVIRDLRFDRFSSGLLAVLASTQFVFAQGDDSQALISYNLYGTPGLIDMPTAYSAPDAELAVSTGYFAGSLRNTLSFQITPRLSGSFRYSRVDNWVTATGEATYDRSFDLRYRIADEGAFRPAVAIGVQDFIGTGIYSSEYIVATKRLGANVTVTGGLGWGRLGTQNSFRNPLRLIDPSFEDRPNEFTGTGGQVEQDKLFRGDAAFFGGIAWQARNRLSVKVEYSSDAYREETASGRDLFERESSINIGAAYAISPNATAQLYHLYGSELGGLVTFRLNPKTPAVVGGTGQRPTPVSVRAPGERNMVRWVQQPDAKSILKDSTERLLESEGIDLEGIAIETRDVTVLIGNETYVANAEAIGRTARILTRVMPASVETFRIVPVVGGVRASEVTILRSDMEQLEFAPDNAWKSYARANINAAAEIPPTVSYANGLYPRFRWGLGPYLNTTYFDPDAPIQLDFGVELSLNYDIGPGLRMSADVRQRIAHSREDPSPSASAIEPVRTIGSLYGNDGTPVINRLTAQYQTNLAGDYYGRVTVGYLEKMYGGISTEVLWKPVRSRLVVGLELNYVKQRERDQRLGFRDYDVVTGHLSGYYDFDNGFHGQVDVGRYLAGDYGATFSLDREFDNGWRVGAFATFTDVSFDDFGEGSFDKGLRLAIPIGHFIGQPTRQTRRITLRPLQRDGGARLNVQDRLYDNLRGYHDTDLRGTWGRFWR